MGDTTNVQLYVFDCPPHRVRAVLDAIDEYNLELDWMGEPDSDRIYLGRVYGNNSGYGYAARDLATLLIQKAPEISFDAWTDPAHDWLGAGVAYTPKLGRFDYESSANGDPLFSSQQIAEALADGGEAAVRKMLGLEWSVANADLLDSLPVQKGQVTAVVIATPEEEED